MWRLLRRALLVLVALLLLGVILTAATRQGRAAVRTVLLVSQVLPSVPLKPQEWFTSEPIREEVRFPIAGGRGLADIYRPADSEQHSAVLLFLGVNPAGRDDSRVVNLASGFARAGMVVMIPWSDSMTQKRIAAEDVDNLVRAFMYLRSLPFVDPDRVGMGGFCVGASLSAVAAQDPRVRDNVRFLNSFGGYYDAVDLLKAVVSRSRFSDGLVEPWQPDRLSVEVIASHLIESVPAPEDRALLYKVFVEREASLAVDPESLSSAGEAVFQLLSGVSLDQVDGLLARLHPSFIESLKTISPSTNIGMLKASVLVMHDREDPLVPSEESARLVEALASGDVYYTEFSFFQHLDPTRSVSPPVFAKEAFKLFLHLYQIMREVS